MSPRLTPYQVEWATKGHQKVYDPTRVYEPKILKQGVVGGGESARLGGEFATLGPIHKQIPVTPEEDEAWAGVPVATAFETKDSGTRQNFGTGSRRDNRSGKGRYDLLPPYALQRVAQVFERGAEKYDDRNWEKGQPLCRYLDSALRHTFQVLQGRTDEDHAGHAIFNLLAFIETQERIREGVLPAELDDLPRGAG